MELYKEIQELYVGFRALRHHQLAERGDEHVIRVIAARLDDHADVRRAARLAGRPWQTIQIGIRTYVRN